eukprot:CAMPEP_0194286238 /NCGR_PEP_ID=MMETSP0169-20130528/32124_1 /TAXON_ID=218684 /ORGANISM="Corethron pennatum, Strain L29A3" /LENGTH=37 /DNA_ID= /DNA_START= /DNA_END= /DNA_ORIENTATION=
MAEDDNGAAVGDHDSAVLVNVVAVVDFDVGAAVIDAV